MKTKPHHRVKLILLNFIAGLIFITTPVFSTSFEESIILSDTHFNQRHIENNLEKSISILEKQLTNPLTNDEKYIVLWKLAQRYVDLPYYSNINTETLIQKIEKTENIVKQVTEIKPNGIEGLYWYTILIGRKGELRGVLNSLFLVPIIQKNMLSIIKIAPDFHRAYFVLSRLHRKAPGFISIGDINKAQNYINKALSFDNLESLYLLELAEVQIARKKIIEAKSTLNQLINLEENSKYFIGTVKRNKNDAKTLLEQLK